MNLVASLSSQEQNSYCIVDKLSLTTVDIIRSEGELKNCALYGF